MSNLYFFLFVSIIVFITIFTISMHPSVSEKSDPAPYILTKYNDRNLQVMFSPQQGSLALTNLPGTFFHSRILPLGLNKKIVARYTIQLSDGKYIEYNLSTKKFTHSSSVNNNTLILVQIPLHPTISLGTIKKNLSGFIMSTDLKYFFAPSNLGYFEPTIYSPDDILAAKNIALLKFEPKFSPAGS